MVMHNVSKRRLSVFSLVMINVIAIDSLRNLPANAANGLSLVLLYLIAGVFFLIPCLLVTAELATHHPRSGGIYVWMREAFGPQWGLLSIWLQWIYNIFWYPTILSFIATHIAYLINPALAMQKAFVLPIVISLFLLATLFNLRGMQASSTLSTFCAIVGTIIPMAAMVALSAGWIFSGNPILFANHHWLPNLTSMPNIAFLVIILFSLMGFEMSASHAESVKNPVRDFPKALAYSGVIVIASMIFSSLAIVAVIPVKGLNIMTGLNDALQIFLNHFHLGWLMPVVLVMIIIGGFGGMSAWVIGPTKGIVVAAEDGLLPKIMQVRNQNGAPVAVLWIQTAVTLGLCCLFLCFDSISTFYWILSVITAQLALIFYICLFAAAIKLRYKTPHHSQAFRIPGGRFGIWLTGGLGIFTCLAAILIGFIPPTDVIIQNKLIYEMILVAGIFILTLLPFLISQFHQTQLIRNKLTEITT